jgi:hypothetical protein
VPTLQRNRILASLAASLLAGTTLGASAQTAPDPVDAETTELRPAARLAPTDPYAYPGYGTSPTEERLRPGVYPAQPEPPEYPASFAEESPPPLDWSIGLRGTYANSNGESSFVTRLTPTISYTHRGSTIDFVVDGDAEIAKSLTSDGQPTVTSAGVGFATTVPLDPTTTFSSNGALRLSQDLPNTPGLSPFITTPPQVYTGSVGVGLTREFGRINVGIGAGARRVVYGATERTDTGSTDNSEQNYWSGSANLRLGYQFTPILEIFGEGELQRDIFDVRTASIGLFPNATNRTLRAGIAADWNEVWSASASVGVGQRVFDETQLGEVNAQLYAAELTFRPDETIQLTAGLETTLAPGGVDTTATARVENTAFANAQYEVNSWLRLRASAEWSRAELVGTDTTENRWALGTGADYALSANTSLNADYGYANSDTATGNTQTHQVSLGIKLTR